MRRGTPSALSHLVICGGFARGWARRSLPPEALEQMETLVKLIEQGWGSSDPSFRQVFATQFMPDASLAAVHAFNDLMPLTASARTAATIFKANSMIDVQAEARSIRCPTLVLHGRGEVRIPFEEGRIIAGLIPGSRFVPLETRNHLMTQDEPAWGHFLEALAAFYPPAGAPPGAAAFPALTAREREVLDLIAQGLGQRADCGAARFVGEDVRNNITHIFDKLGVENRPQAIVLARDRGLGAR